MTIEERLEKLEQELAETKDSLTASKRLIRRMKVGEAILVLVFFFLPLVMTIIWVVTHGLYN